jgi:putative sigma-54 modulation protein
MSQEASSFSPWTFGFRYCDLTLPRSSPFYFILHTNNGCSIFHMSVATSYQQVKSGHRVEIVTDIKGTTIICKNESPDMYESIDQAGHALQRKLVKYKERRNEGYHGGMAMGEDLRTALEELEAEDAAAASAPAAAVSKGPAAAADEAFFYEEAASPYQKTVTPVKSFQLDRPISLEEAIFALDYVDHDFYVFRNQDTKEINVVYKRHTGGIGLVAPEESSK